MKKFFTLLILCTVFLTACKKDDPEVNKELTLTSESIAEYPAAGGNIIITYALDNATENDVVEYSTTASWLVEEMSESTLKDGKLTGRLYYTIAENLFEARKGKIILTYKDQSVEVTIKQEAKEVGNKMLMLLSDEVVNIPIEGGLVEIKYAITNAEYADEATHRCNKTMWIKIFESSSELSTQGREGRILYQVEANDGEERTAQITLTYENQTEVITVNQAGSEADNEQLSTLTGNIEFNATGAFVYCEGYNITGSTYWGVLTTCETENGEEHSILLELNSAAGSTTPEGTYTSAGSNSGPQIGTFKVGRKPGPDDMLPPGSWYMEMHDSAITNNIAPLADGTVDITENNGIYTIIVDCVDDKGNTIKATISGEGIVVI